MSDSEKRLNNIKLNDKNKANSNRNCQDEALINNITTIMECDDLSDSETDSDDYVTSFEYCSDSSEEEQDSFPVNQSTGKRNKQNIEKRKYSDNDILNEKTDIYKCVKLIEKLVNDNKEKLREIKWKNAERKFQEWNNYSKKHLKDFYFDDLLFRDVYLLNLYWRRAESFFHLLEKFGKNRQNSAKLRNCKSIVSFGCGAAPEIAAFLHFYKVKLGYRNCNNISRIIGVDSIKDWKSYISVVENVFKTDFLFINEEINENFVSNLENFDLLVLSYSYDPKYGNIWNDLKIKCKIIIIMHENEELFQNLNDNGYKSCTFLDNPYGRKTFYYFIQED